MGEGLTSNERVKGINELCAEALREGFAFTYHALPPALRDRLIEYVARTNTRKTILSGEALSKVPILMDLIRDKLERDIPIPGSDQVLVFRPNEVIIKHYTPGDGSKAYDLHHDPEEYQGILILISLSGETIFEIEDKEGQRRQIKCVPNTMVIMVGTNTGSFVSQNPRHRVDPPQIGSRRDLIFFGMNAKIK